LPGPDAPPGRSLLARLGDVTTGLYLIAAICGLVDAVCFLRLGHVFAEMMTGNLLLLAFSIGTGAPFAGGARYLPAILAFTAGALLGGRLLRGPEKLKERRIGFAVEWLVLVAATVHAGVNAPSDDNMAGQILIAALALAMGLQNAMVREHGVPDLATNVMTLTYTGIIADSGLAGGDNRNWRRRGLSIGLFCASAAIGAVLLQFGLVWPLVLASTVFSVAMLPLLFGAHPLRR
jgi:uncharacterized membrane protein YoaK (UPF0700 family)